jgi:long-subunit fatty acid transport protein
MMVSQLPDAFSSLGADGGYSYSASFEGSSIYLGIQGGISYAINDMISVYAGARYVMAKNTYNGTITDVTLTSLNPTLPLLTNTTLTGAADSYQAGGDDLQASFDGGVPTATPITTAEPTGGDVTNGLLALGYSQAAINTMNLGQAQAVFYGASDDLATGASYLADKELETEQTGNGITPILGLNLSLMEDKLNIGLKYEFQTNMEVTNKTTKDVMIGVDDNGDPITMYPDGAKENADIPAMLSIGIGYKISDKLSTQIGYHTYFDKKAGWSEIDDPEDFTAPYTQVSVIDKNYWEFGIGFEYNINEKLLFSLGYLRAQTGVNDYYQSDMSYSLPSNTFGLGGAYRINDMINLNLGGYYTMYSEDTAKPSPNAPYSQTYNKSNFAFALGLDFAFGGGK